MTLVLNRLEAAGHVTRDRHPSDRRKMIVSASGEASDRAYGHVTPLIEGVESVIASLTDSERAVIEAFLRRLLATYDNVTPTPRAVGVQRASLQSVNGTLGSGKGSSFKQ